jgi:lipopolysaccharide/colanic/teichoic acid biosynthesis glycosyltransferase
MRIFYKPAYAYLVVDLFILILGFYIVLDWFPLTTNTPFDKYSWASFFYMLTWIIYSYFFQRYKPLRTQKYFNSILKLFFTTLTLFFLYSILIHFFFKLYSGFVLLTISVGTFIVNYIFLSLYFAYKFAVEYNDIVFKSIEKRDNAVVKPAVKLDEESYQQLSNVISKHSGTKVLKYLESIVDLESGNTLVYIKTDTDNLQMLPNYQYSTIVQLERLNNMRGVNSHLSIINEKLSDNGILVCCFESKSTRKRRLLLKYPVGINYLVYTIDFILKRVMPKIFLSRNFYYFLTGGRDRIFSKTEVLGRLYCFGFVVISEKKIGGLNYITVKRVKQPEEIQKRIYGPMIRLRRLGMNRELIDVYKMRTMHPYSEYLQSYIHEKNNLTSGGKFYKDIRITALGSIMRKYWIDELPMILNLLKGEMKLVGVRPLSTHYFNLYNKELQELRVRFKPGLLPPFYADMPQTLDEIQESETNYLLACQDNGVFITDLKYLFRILKNILFRNARSA